MEKDFMKKKSYFIALTGLLAMSTISSYAAPAPITIGQKATGGPCIIGTFCLYIELPTQTNMDGESYQTDVSLNFVLNNQPYSTGPTTETFPPGKSLLATVAPGYTVNSAAVTLTNYKYKASTDHAYYPMLGRCDLSWILPQPGEITIQITIDHSTNTYNCKPY